MLSAHSPQPPPSDLISRLTSSMQSEIAKIQWHTIGAITGGPSEPSPKQLTLAVHPSSMS
eukprot:1184110-Prorocentrum_minimum.AAC.6